MSWNPIVDDSFVHATTSAAGAGSTAGVPTDPTAHGGLGAANGWTDNAGGIYSIPSSGQLQAQSTTTTYGANVLLRATTEGGNPDQRIVLDTTGSGGHIGAVVRWLNGTNFYLCEFNVVTGNWAIYSATTGAGLVFANGTSSTGTIPSLNTGHTYEVDFSAASASPSMLALVITDTSNSTQVLNYSCSDNSTGLQASNLQSGISQWGGGTETQLYSRARVYNFAAGTPAVGTVTVTSATTSTINLAPASISGATSYQWYRSTTSGFTPGGGNLLSGATSSTLADSTATAGIDYFYALIATNGTGSTTSNQCYGRRLDAALAFSAIGESTYNGFNADGSGGDQATNSIPVLMGQALQVAGQLRSVAVQNSAADGQATDHFFTTTAQAALTTAVAAAVSNGSTYCHLMFGVNDACNSGNSAATFRAHVAGICAAYVTAGIKMVLHDGYLPPTDGVVSAVTPAAIALMESYPSQLDSLADGATIFRGDRAGARLPSLAVSAYISSDHLHLSVLGNREVAAAQARAFDRILNPSAAASAPISSNSWSFVG